MAESSKILKTKKKIMEYLEITSDDTFRGYVEVGLPAVVINGRWHAHVDNLDEFFRVITRKGTRGAMPEAAE
jgi:hypothetical protein